MGRTILIVDDERSILKAFVRLFMGSEFEVLIAEGGQEALEILAKENVDMIISDMRMPEMDGYALLRRVKTLYPSMIRIILSGYAEEQQILKALQNNLAKLYMLKPWNNDTIEMTIRHIFETEDELKDVQLFQKLNAWGDLPTISANYQHLTALIEQDADMEHIAVAIERDQAVAARVLRIANSAFFGAKTASIRQAITYLGLHNVRNIVLTCSIFESAAPVPEVAFHKDLLWRHATLTSRLMSLIYQKFMNKKPQPEALTAGLLHDIGKAVFLRWFPEKYAEVLRKVQGSDFSYQTSYEREIFGFEHGVIGAFLLDWWELPFALSESARFHHDPGNPRIVNKELVAAVHLADFYSWRLCDVEIDTEISSAALDILGIRQEQMEAAVFADIAKLTEDMT